MWSITIQSQFVDKGGRQERSYGLCQLNLDARPDITIEMADSPEFCLPYMADEWKDGGQRAWSAWRELHAKYGDKPWPI